MTKAPPPVYATAAPTPATNAIDDRLLDAKLDAVEARTETKFAQLMGKIETLIESVAGVKEDVREVNNRLDTVEDKVFTSKALVVTTIIGAFLGMGALVIGMLAYTVQLADFLRP